MCCRVTGRAGQIPHRCHLRIEPVGHAAGRIRCGRREARVNPMPSRIMPRHERCATGRANRAGNIELLESGRLDHQPVDMRRLHVRVPEGPGVGPALIVQQDENDVGPARRRVDGAGCRTRQQPHNDSCQQELRCTKGCGRRRRVSGESSRVH